MATPSGSAAAPAPGPSIGVEEVRAGMRGFGLTVMDGARVDTFQVEVLGVQRGARRPRRDRILARLSGLGLERTGVVAGMSGSPVYLEGRLVGAVSAGWTFATEPVCQITPIDEMLAVGDLDLDAPAASPGSGPAGTAPAGGLGQRIPLWVSGGGPEARRLLGQILGPLGLEPVEAPATGAGPGPAGAALSPGSAVALQLVRGDLSVAVIGTVTHVDGQRLLAFGHPLIPAGAIDMPLAAVHVFGVVPNQVSSFKIGAAGAPLGAWRQDRPGAVAGVLGAEAAMLPLEVAVEAPTGPSRYAFELVRHPLLAAGLAQSALLGSLESSAPLVGDATVALRFDADLDDGRTVSWRRVYGGAGAAVAAAIDAGEPLLALAAPAVADVRLSRLRVRAILEESIHLARIAGARLDRDRARPGESVVLSVRLATHGGGERVVSVPLTVPADGPSPLWLRVGSGAAACAWDDERLALGPPADSDDLLARLGCGRDDDVLAVEVLSAEPGLAREGRELPAPPPSVARLLSEGHAAGQFEPVRGRVLARARQPVDVVLTGELSLRLAVEPGESP